MSDTQPISTAAALQTEVVNYMQFAASEADTLLRCLTAERDALLATAPSASSIAPALLSFTLTAQSEALTGYRRIELASERAAGFIEANGTSIGLVQTEIKHKKTDAKLCDTSNRRTEVVADKEIEAQCHSIVRILLLA